MDVSSTTRVARVVVQHQRTGDPSWTKSEWSPTCRMTVEETIRKSFAANRTRDNTELGMPICASKNKDCSCWYAWVTSKWLGESGVWVQCGRNAWNWSILQNQHHFLTTCIWDVLNVNADRKDHCRVQKDVRITNFCRSNWKTCSKDADTHEWSSSTILKWVKYPKKYPGRFVHDENTRFCSASVGIGHVSPRIWSKSSLAKLSKIENHGKQTHWSDD